MTASFSAADVLDMLDYYWEDLEYPNLDSGCLEPVAVRMTAFSDKTRWALILEAIMLTDTGDRHHNVRDDTYCYGNCLTVPLGWQRSARMVTGDGPEGPTFNEDFGFGCTVLPSARTIRLRDTVVEIPKKRIDYIREGVTLRDYPQIDIVALMRLLAVRHYDLLFESDETLQANLQVPLPIILRLQRWHHPSWFKDEKPSDTMCFRMIAEALERADPSFYRPCEPENTHWGHHPYAGML
jgi:hypothetical protein